MPQKRKRHHIDLSIEPKQKKRKIQKIKPHQDKLATKPRELKRKLKLQLQQNKIKIDTDTFHSILQTLFCEDRSNEDYLKKATEFILAKTSFPELELVPNKLCELNKIFKNKDEQIHFEIKHFLKVWQSLDTKYAFNQAELERRPYLKILYAVCFWNNYNFVKPDKGECNLKFSIGYNQDHILKALQEVNAHCAFANKIISEMIGSDKLIFDLRLSADKYEDHDGYTGWCTSGWSVFDCQKVYYQRKKIKTTNDDGSCGSMYMRNSRVAADDICETMTLLREYNVDSRKLYELVCIVIDEFCAAANEEETKWHLKSALNYSNFFGDDVNCYVHLR